MVEEIGETLRVAETRHRLARCAGRSSTEDHHGSFDAGLRRSASDRAVRAMGSRRLQRDDASGPRTMGNLTVADPPLRTSPRFGSVRSERWS